MWKRLTLLWTVLRGDARQLWFALRHPGALAAAGLTPPAGIA